MTITIYSDGGADPNPGIGGWAAIVRRGKDEEVLTGNEPHTTNNRMELTAAVAALKSIARPEKVEVYTDSEYVRRGITEWIDAWIQKNWRTQGGKPVANEDLWRELMTQTQRHQIEWHWVRGHSGDEMNERVDQLARQARMEITPTVEISEDVPRLYVRASCKGSPGPGGWGVVLEQQGQTRQYSGSEPSTTNNRMEIRAAIEALNIVRTGATAQVITTSDYVYQGATKWIHGWRRRDWQKKGGQTIANADLWQELDQLMAQRNVKWVNAKGGGDDIPQGLREAARLAQDAATVV